VVLCLSCRSWPPLMEKRAKCLAIVSEYLRAIFTK
jgi:hypothetical protein